MGAVTQIPIADADSTAAREVCRRREPSFYFATFFLPVEKRRAAQALYAFAMMVRDALVVEEGESACGPQLPGGSSCCEASGLDRRLELLQQRIDGLYLPPAESSAAASPEERIIAVVSHAIGRYSIPKQYFLDFARGRRMEWAIQRFATWNALEQYLTLSGGSAALALAAVLGVTHSESAGAIVDLGRAFALTRLLGRLQEDWQRGFLWLPQEDLARFRCREKDLAADPIKSCWQELLAFEAQRARSLYASGTAVLPWLAGDGSRLAASMLIAWGLARLKGESIGRPRMLLRAWRLAGRQESEPLPAYFNPRESKRH